MFMDPDYYSISKNNANPQNLYVFGDNTHRRGKGGQAIIRDCPNAIGIITKKYPSYGRDAFFYDFDLEQYKKLLDLDLERIKTRFSQGGYKTLIFPIAGLGTGLASLPDTSPLCFQYLCQRLYEFTGYKHTEKGFLVTG